MIPTEPRPPQWFYDYLVWREAASVIHAKFVGNRYHVNSDEDKRFLALALCGETGELANMVKKLWRGDSVPLIEIHKELAEPSVSDPLPSPR